MATVICIIVYNIPTEILVQESFTGAFMLGRNRIVFNFDSDNDREDTLVDITLTDDFFLDEEAPRGHMIMVCAKAAGVAVFDDPEEKMMFELADLLEEKVAQYDRSRGKTKCAYKAEVVFGTLEKSEEE